MIAIYTEACARDISEAADWYRRRDANLAEDFLDAIEERVGSLLEFPESQELALRRTRRAFLARFPYTLYYLIDEQHLHLLACLHQSRHPRRWQGRVRERPVSSGYTDA